MREALTSPTQRIGEATRPAISAALGTEPRLSRAGFDGLFGMD